MSFQAQLTFPKLDPESRWDETNSERRSRNVSDAFHKLCWTWSSSYSSWSQIRVQIPNILDTPQVNVGHDGIKRIHLRYVLAILTGWIQEIQEIPMPSMRGPVPILGTSTHWVIIINSCHNPFGYPKSYGYPNFGYIAIHYLELWHFEIVTSFLPSFVTSLTFRDDLPRWQRWLGKYPCSGPT